MLSKVKVVGFVDIGCRKKNDDRIMIGNRVYESGKHGMVLQTPCSIALCDGVGGSADGDMAAEYVLTKLAENSLNHLETEEQFHALLADVNNELIQYQQKIAIVNGMRTTIVGLTIFDNKIIFYNSGDSRLYRNRNHILRKLSEDHSVAQEKINNGVITRNYEEELMKCSNITRCLGVKGVLPPFIQRLNHPALPNDLFLLCSDGLWGVVSDDCIEVVLNSEMTLEEKVDSLYNLSIQNNSQDNISIILAEYEKVEINNAKER